PAIDRRMVDRNAAFRQHFLKVAIADRIATIPAHRPQEHITLEMAPLEIRHRSVRPISAKHAQASRLLQQSHSIRSQFALISSSMFITRQKMIERRLESRLRFANTLTWNTFTVPELDEKTRKRIIKAGQKVLAARTAPGAFPRGALQPAGYDTRTGEGA